MSSGIDFGNKYCVISVVQRGGVDIVVNEVNLRQTSSLVGFTETERDIGEAGATKLLRNPQNTISQLKKIIGRKWSEAEFQQETPYLTYKVKPIGPDNNDIGVEVTYKGERVTLTPVEVVGMLLRKLKSIAEKGMNTNVRDIVISVPAYFTSQQRQALLDATRVAGINCLRLINDTTAVALSYGIYKTDLPEKDPVNVMFVDMGDSQTTVSIVAFVKGKLKVLSHAFDQSLGGRNFDRGLVDYFCEEFKTKYKLDIKSNLRARARLEVACERLKRVLSANIEAPLSVECIMNDTDVKGMITRAQFETISKPLLERIAAPIRKALEDAKLTMDQISSVELIGGSTRVPSVANKVSEVTGRPFSRTLNAEESCAKGCALQSAILSPLFQVREYKIDDYNPYPIEVVWRDLENSNPSSSEEPTLVFPKGAISPGMKVVTFPRGKPFEMIANYSQSAELSAGSDRFLGRWTVANVPESKSGEKVKVRVKVRLNIHGILGVESAYTEETVKEAAPAPAADPQAMDVDAGKKTEGADPTKMETSEEEAKKTAAAPAATTVSPPPAKVVKTNLRVDAVTGAIRDVDMTKLAADEEKRVRDDLEVYETAELRNALESYVYESRNSLNGEWSEFVPSSVKDSMLQQLEATQDWLYTSEGESAKKADFQSRLNQLKQIGDPIDNRRREYQGRDDAINSLNETLQYWRNFAGTTDAKYEHITKEDREKVLTKIKEVEDSLMEKIEKQKKAAKTENPGVLISDILHGRDNVERYSKPIMSKSKPAPPKKEEKKPEPEKKDEKMQTDQNKGQGTDAKDKMDVDSGETKEKD